MFNVKRGYYNQELKKKKSNLISHLKSRHGEMYNNYLKDKDLKNGEINWTPRKHKA